MKNIYKQEFLSILLNIKNQKLLNAFMLDVLTPQEYEEIVKRWQIVKQLNDGITQRKIAKNLKISLSKISRGSRMLLNSKGGFNEILRNKK
ncbi:MAG: hypothetical protein A2537_00640 [Candidatus Magasanikbacteria bacterium RIFOXYD2_FULL_36_9]|uniref:Transcriptional regulator n=1 Tax=Candidatus Magasanikbacteria bacterium RIFOXYD2_FULL_36_9 TaxID=1798707 RepID=A0A1F6NY51_9BACT|nr:MAG: hypothetical protein A2537_00640 [Candidatus Magasanikbacteria bacterium RIFOXYD2_FULL_36_9]